ncbi:MAG TPA: hypothetical protein VKI61_10360 [Chitinophagaceae bacterium]|jgi:hypothetical protein|nr:hypothetical protein [Chitinophagaceae bacterium]
MKTPFNDDTSAVSKEQTKDFGMVMTLVAVFLAVYLKEFNYAKLAFALILLTIVVPVLFYPFAFCWFGLSRFLGQISTAVLLAILYVLIIIPIGFLRRVAGYDGLQLKQFKKSKKSVLADRNHVFDNTDLLNTF